LGNEFMIIINYSILILRPEFTIFWAIFITSFLTFNTCVPNHLHAVIIICRNVLQYTRTTESMSISNSLLRSPSQTIGAIVRGFKGAATKQINQIRDLPGTPIWQRNYYESIIRSENDLNRVREYIINNPIQWDLDEENPTNHKSVGAYCNTPLLP
jgi:REP element-mobilizing transposase RayT